MPCFHPIQAWRQAATGPVYLGAAPPGVEPLKLPCSKCAGCRASAARQWALRCQLERQQHEKAAFTTLTYDDEHLPPTLAKRDLQLWLKRVRRSSPDRSIRFFACGEYGEKNGRPHYHAIVYGVGKTDAALLDAAWQRGHTVTYDASPATIAYTAGYTAKKYMPLRDIHKERVDPETGEVYTWQLPFLQMSRRPGLAAFAKQWPSSWRSYAILNGAKAPVPRFLHEAWKAQATAEEQLQLIEEKKIALAETTPEMLRAAEHIAHAKYLIATGRRRVA